MDLFHNLNQDDTVDGFRNPAWRSPVEVGSEYPIIYDGFYTSKRWFSRRISGCHQQLSRDSFYLPGLFQSSNELHPRGPKGEWGSESDPKVFSAKFLLTLVVVERLEVVETYPVISQVFKKEHLYVESFKIKEGQ